MLKVVDDIPREEEWAYQEALKAMQTCDKFILMYEREGIVEHVQFRLSNVELIYYCEVVKHFVLNERA